MNNKLFSALIIFLYIPSLYGGNLTEIIKLGLENNLDYIIQKRELEKSKNSLKVEYSSFMPKIATELNNTNRDVDKLSLDNAEAKVNANINLFSGGQDNAKLERAKLDIENSEESLRRVRADLTYNIKTEFYNTIYANELNELLNSIAKRRADQLKYIKMLYDAGREDKGNYLQAKAKLSRAKAEISQSKRYLASTLDKLSNYTNTQKNTLPSPKGLLEDEASFLEGSIKKNFEVQIPLSPEVAIARNAIKISEKNIVIAKSSFSPTLDVGGSIGKTGSNFNNLNNDSNTIGITVSIPIFDGGSDYYKTKNSKIEKINTEFNLRKIKNDMLVNVRDSKYSLNNNYEDISIQKESLQASEIRAKVATGKYQSGLMTYSTWETIQDELVENEKNMLNVLRLTLISKAKLDNILGIGASDE